MNIFKSKPKGIGYSVGDKVIVVNKGNMYYNQKGIVTHIESDGFTTVNLMSTQETYPITTSFYSPELKKIK